MSCDYKCILIIGLIIGGLASIYINNTDLASVIFGGLIGYLSHGVSSGVSSVNDGVSSSEVGVSSSEVGVSSSENSVISDDVEDDEGA